MSRQLHQHQIKEDVGHKERGTTIVTAFDLDCGYSENSIPLVQLVADLQTVLDGIPPEFRESAVLTVKAYGDYASAYADVTFQRPETDDELADRRRWLKGLDDERNQQDEREYARLQRKFGHG